MKLQFPAQITKVETTSDRGLRLKMVTPELGATEKALLFSYGESQIYCALDEIAITHMDTPDEVDAPGDKSPSKRLKNVLYVLWKEKTTRDKSFDQFYRDYVEKVIDQVKDKLD